MIRNASLRQLKVFESVARNLSVTRTAEELFLTQPTVSIQIKQLTELVGLPLTEQIGKRLYLTEAGRELQKVCKRVFDDLDHYEMLVSDLKGMKAGKLSLAVITTAKYFIPRLLGQFCQRYPGIDVKLKVTNRERVLERMAENLDDLYVLGVPSEDPDVVFEPFLKNPLVILAPSAHPLAKQSGISPAALAGESFIMREAGSGVRLAVEQFFKERGVSLKVRMELGSNETIKQAVAGGLGIAALSAHALVLDRTSDDIAILDVEGFPLKRHLYLAYPQNRQMSVVGTTFLSFLKQEGVLFAEKYLQGLESIRRSNDGLAYWGEDQGQPT